MDSHAKEVSGQDEYYKDSYKIRCFANAERTSRTKVCLSLQSLHEACCLVIIIITSQVDSSHTKTPTVSILRKV